MSVYWRPIAMMDMLRPEGALTLAGGWCWFDRLERIERGARSQIVSVSEVTTDVIEVLTKNQPDILGLSLDRPHIMGIVNVTPDSFSDGGRYDGAAGAVAAGLQMVVDGAGILDVGGESTRPGAAQVGVDEEISRINPVIRGLHAAAPISIDTRKSSVGRAALECGALMVNDVSALNFDQELGTVAADANAAICLVHAQGAPETMQNRPSYDDVLLDVYDGLSAAISRAIAAGIDRKNTIIDPGIGFGKTHEHNLTLLRGLSLFHSLGVPVLLGASRKRFIGKITDRAKANERLVGSLTVAQWALAQGIQIVRVHDVRETREVFDMVQAISGQK